MNPTTIGLDIAKTCFRRMGWTKACHAVGRRWFWKTRGRPLQYCEWVQRAKRPRKKRSTR